MIGIMKDREIVSLNGDAIDEAAAMAERVAKLPKGVLIKNDSMKIEICEAGGADVKVKGKIISCNFMWNFKDGDSTFYAENVVDILTLFYDLMNIFHAHFSDNNIAYIDFDPEKTINNLVKCSDDRFDRLLEMVNSFKWPNKNYTSRSGNLDFMYHTRGTDHKNAQKLIEALDSFYGTEQWTVLLAKKGSKQFVMVFSKYSAFYLPDQLDSLNSLINDIIRITFKFIINPESGNTSSLNQYKDRWENKLN
jgi:hypothetical protein